MGKGDVPTLPRRSLVSGFAEIQSIFGYGVNWGHKSVQLTVSLSGLLFIQRSMEKAFVSYRLWLLGALP